MTLDSGTGAPDVNADPISSAPRSAEAHEPSPDDARRRPHRRARTHRDSARRQRRRPQQDAPLSSVRYRRSRRNRRQGRSTHGARFARSEATPCASLSPGRRSRRRAGRTTPNICGAIGFFSMRRRRPTFTSSSTSTKTSFTPLSAATVSRNGRSEASPTARRTTTAHSPSGPCRISIPLAR